jgi:hypothetical protein
VGREEKQPFSQSESEKGSSLRLPFAGKGKFRGARDLQQFNGDLALSAFGGGVEAQKSKARLIVRLRRKKQNNTAREEFHLLLESFASCYVVS